MNKWSIYLLSSGTRTYIGATTNVERRLRQHNGEIQGGARSTRGRKWKIVIVISGFLDRSEAYRWEKLAKSRSPRGLTARKKTLFGIFWGICPGEGTKKKQYKVPEKLSCSVHDYIGSRSLTEMETSQK